MCRVVFFLTEWRELLWVHQFYSGVAFKAWVVGLYFEAFNTAELKYVLNNLSKCTWTKIPGFVNFP